MNATETRMTVDQQRAAHAWQSIANIVRKGKQEQGEYKGEAKKLPVRIMGSGLGQALAFIYAKSRKREILVQLHKDLTSWVSCRLDGEMKDRQNLLRSICDGDAEFLRRATTESLAYLQWLNRFAEAEIQADDVAGDTDE